MESGGGIIRGLRMAKGTSLKELGEMVGAHYVYLSKLERGMEIPSEELIRTLAATLDYRGDLNELVASFGKVPKDIKKYIIDDPSSVVELPVFFKSRRKI